MSRSAELLGVTRPTLYDLMAKYDIRGDADERRPSRSTLRRNRRGNAAPQQTGANAAQQRTGADLTDCP